MLSLAGNLIVWRIGTLGLRQCDRSFKEIRPEMILSYHTFAPGWNLCMRYGILSTVAI